VYRIDEDELGTPGEPAVSAVPAAAGVAPPVVVPAPHGVAAGDPAPDVSEERPEEGPEDAPADGPDGVAAPGAVVRSLMQ